MRICKWLHKGAVFMKIWKASNALVPEKGAVKCQEILDQNA